MSSVPETAPARDGAASPKNKSPNQTHAGIVRSAGVVSGAVFLSRITGLVREVVFARFFGAGMVYDAFVAAYRIPNLFRDLLAEGALSAAFVTTFSQCLSQGGQDKAYRLSNRLASLLVPVILLICLLGAWFAPAIVDSMFPGYGEVEGKRDLTVLLTRIMIPFLLFMALAAKAMGVLNTKGRFGIPALASAFANVTSIVCGLTLAFVVGPRFDLEPIAGMAIGILLGGLAQYAVQWPSLRRIGLRFRPDFRYNDPGIRQVLRLMGPAVLGAAAVQVNVVVNSIFASQITDAAGTVVDGPVSWLGYAFRLMQLPLGLFGVAVASATLPSISRSAGAGQIDEFRDTLANSLGLVFLMTIPSAAGLAVLSRSVVGVVYQHGAFTAEDTEQTAVALSLYCVGLAGYAAIKVLTPAFYALDDVRVPALTSLASIFINYLLNWTFVRVLGWGHGGLAFSTSTVAFFNFFVLFWFMRKRIDGIHGRRLVSSITFIGLAAGLMCAACATSSFLVHQAFGASFLGRLLDLAVSIPLGASVLFGACRLFRVSELEVAGQAIRARLARRTTSQTGSSSEAL